MLTDDGRRSRAVQAGDTFAVPLDDGRFGAVRVLRTSADDDGSVTALVALTPWIGDRVPDLREPRLREILKLHRGFYQGRPAICWYDGEPPEDFVHIGVITAAPAELAMDPRGAYGGQWSSAMARDVELESRSKDDATHQSKTDGSKVRVQGDRVAGVMTQEEFWRVLELLDWEAPHDDGIIAPIVHYLAGLEPDKIAGFHRMLCEKLHELDREEFAREIGEYSLESEEGFSPDHFLDVRCAVVANGREFYQHVLSNPKLMPKDREFEVLVTVAERAYRKKTGRMPLFLGAKAYETFSNRAGWRSLNG